MLLLHPAPAPSANKPSPRKDDLGFTSLRQPRSPKDVLVGVASAVDVLQYPGTDVTLRAPHIKRAVRCQTSDRVCRKQSALICGSAGGVVGLLAGCASGPFFPVVGAGGALLGAAVGAAAPWKEAASFGQVRKHLFYKSGIVESRAESATLVAALKKNKILRKGRGRDILALKDLDAVLERQPYLKAKQRKQVRECLEFIAREGANFDALTQERIRLQGAIAQARKGRRSHGQAPPDLQALYLRQATIDSRLLAGAPGGPSVPRAVRQSAKVPLPAKPAKGQALAAQTPKALSGPQHMRVGRSA